MSSETDKIIDTIFLKCFKNILETLNENSIDYTIIADIISTEYNIIINNDVISNRISNIFKYRKILRELKKLPLVKQRTIEWLDMRKDRLTASDLGDAIKEGAVSNSLALKKANITVDNINYNAIPALKWGTMFENMASRCYSQANYNIHIEEFGLICDKNNIHFGASPDGINELGIMIEIKCPYSRKIIENYIPPKYYMQIQGQLAVCELEECDYIECDFDTFDTFDEYNSNISQNINDNHGIIAEFRTQNDEYFYLYSDEYLTPKEAEKNIRDQISNFDNKYNYLFSKFIPWKLNEMKVQRVKFNKNEWSAIDDKIKYFWEKVEQVKIDPPIQKSRKKIKFIDDN